MQKARGSLLCLGVWSSWIFLQAPTPALRKYLEPLLKVARLQSEFCTKDFFRATNFVTKNAPSFSLNFLSLCSVGQKKSRKIPSKFPAKFSKFPCEKSKKNHRRASTGAQGEPLLL